MDRPTRTARRRQARRERARGEAPSWPRSHACAHAYYRRRRVAAGRRKRRAASRRVRELVAQRGRELGAGVGERDQAEGGHRAVVHPDVADRAAVSDQRGSRTQGLERRHAARGVDGHVGSAQDLVHALGEPPDVDPMPARSAPRGSRGGRSLRPVITTTSVSSQASEASTAPARSPTPHPPPQTATRRPLHRQPEAAAGGLAVGGLQEARCDQRSDERGAAWPANRSTGPMPCSCITRCRSAPRCDHRR